MSNTKSALKYLFLSLAVAAATTAQAATFRWEMDATEDQVGNCVGDPASTSCDGDGSTGSTALGHAIITYDSDTTEIGWDIAWNGLQSPLSAIHVHGPELPGESVMPHLWNVYTGEADVIAAGVDRTTDSTVRSLPLFDLMVESATHHPMEVVVNSMVRDLGYVNIHSQGWPRGEIRADFILTESSQTKDQQKCTNGMNSSLRKVAKTSAKELEKCIKDFNDGAGVTDITVCLQSDRDGKIAKAEGKTTQTEEKKCSGDSKDGIPKSPFWGVTNATTVNLAATTAGEALVHATYGADVSANAIPESTDPAASSCQERTAKALGKCQAAMLSDFNKCKKGALKANILGPAPLEDCVFSDAKGSVAKACEDKVLAETQGCVDNGVSLLSTFPDCGSADAATVSDCMATSVACLTCLQINDADGIGANCDELDDGLTNATCP